MDKKEHSRFLSYILRHKPEEVGLALDPNGWVDVSELIEAIQKTGKLLTEELLFEIVATSDKKRFTLSADKTRIRAAQGHSINIDLNLSEHIPPSHLYHGTAAKNIDAIMVEGITRQKRDKVHLSATIETALNVGQRHGKPAIFKINTLDMHKDGIKFWLADNKVWLVDYIAPQYISLLPSITSDK